MYLFSVPDQSWKHGGDQIQQRGNQTGSSGYTAGKGLPPKQCSSSSLGDAVQSDKKIVILNEGEMKTLPIPVDGRESQQQQQQKHQQ